MDRRAPNSARTRFRDADDAIAVMQEHAADLLRHARRFSLCADDAGDAYQRALEIYLRRFETLDPDRAVKWLMVVVRNEARAVRESRLRMVSADGDVLDLAHATTAPGPDERLDAYESLTRSAEALRRMKPAEARALLLKADGLSYARIAEVTGWSPTKVNRLLVEGRRAFRARFADIESGEECERLAPVLSAMADGEATDAQLGDVRPHLRHCGACQATLREFSVAPRRAAAVLPFPALAVADPDLSAFARLAETAHERVLSVTGVVGERFGSAVTRAQGAIEAASGAKLAAVAASATALAGGGAVATEPAAPGAAVPRPAVEQAAAQLGKHARLPEPPTPARSTEPEPSPERTAPSEKPATQPASAGLADASVAPASSPKSAAAPVAERAQPPRQVVKQEFGFESGRARPPSSVAAGSRPTAASRPNAEFGP